MLLLQEGHTLGSLSSGIAVASWFACQTWNSWEATQTVLARSPSSAGGADVTLVAAVAARANGTWGAWHAWLLLKLLHFRRQNI
jgi:hypothetical protein